MTLAKTAKQIAADPEAQYQALQRSLRRRKGFGLLFVQATPAKAAEILQRLHHDLPQKNIGTLALDQPINNLYNLVVQRPDLADLNILFIQGLEKSLEADIKPGYGGEGDYYNLDTVPPLLNHLNQQRDNFRDHFGHLCFVFVVPPFALKYLIRRAADFLDWHSAIFTFGDAKGFGKPVQTSIGSARDHFKKKSGFRGALDHFVENLKLDFLIFRNFLGLEIPEDTTYQNPAEYPEVRKYNSYLEKHQKLFNKGNDFYSSGQYEAAIAAYDAALDIKPDKHEALYNKGIALFNLGQYEAAITAYDAALALKPDDHEALFNKGYVLGELGQYEAAIAAYDAALKIKPDKHEALHNKGIALGNLGEYEAAIAAYNAALALRPDFHEALMDKGLVLFNLGQYEAAIAAYDAALDIKPDYHEALMGKGIALGNLGQYEAAIVAYDAALDIKPDYHEALMGKGIALGNLGQYEAAIAAYDAALDIKPDYHEALYNKGLALFNLGQYEAAIAAYDAALAVKPDKHEALYNKACCYGLQSDADNVIPCLQAAIALDPKYRDMAKTDTDFNPIRTDERFQSLLAGE